LGLIKLKKRGGEKSLDRTWGFLTKGGYPKGQTAHYSTKLEKNPKNTDLIISGKKKGSRKKGADSGLLFSGWVTPITGKVEEAFNLLQKKNK